MHGIGVSAVTAYTAHREWATRPPDERYASVQALYEAARARRVRTEERDHRDRRLQDRGGGDRRARPARRVGSHGRPDALELRAARHHRRRAAEVPPHAARADRLRRDQPRAAAAASRRSTSCSSIGPHPWTVHAITSPRYARVHHDELAGRVLDLMAAHPAWHLPLGYKDGVFGAERVPSGAYLGDRDMFLFLVDGNRDLDDPTDASHAGLFRGFILRNSDVGAAALTLDVFLFRAVCGESHHLGLSARGRLPAPARGGVDSGRVDAPRLRASARPSTPTRPPIAPCSCGPRPRSSVRRATRCSTRSLQRLDLSQKQAAEAYTLAEQHETNPRSVWGYVQGLTRLSQRTPWQDGRFALDRAASRLLTTVH